MRLTGITYAADGRLECRAKYAASALYTPSGTGRAAARCPGRSSGPDRPSANSSTCRCCPRLTIPRIRRRPRRAVRGMARAALYRSDDGGSTWSIPLDGTPPGAVIGVAANALAAHPGTQIDSASALAITLYPGIWKVSRNSPCSAAPIILPTAPPTAGR